MFIKYFYIVSLLIHIFTKKYVLINLNNEYKKIIKDGFFISNE